MVGNPALLLKRLLEEGAERSWLEFKVDNCDPDMVGRTISACANAAMLEEKHKAYIIWGIENKTKKRVGTNVVLANLQKGGENFVNWLSRMIEPRLQLEEYQIASAVIADAKKAKRIIPADPDQGKRNAKYIPYWGRLED